MSLVTIKNSKKGELYKSTNATEAVDSNLRQLALMPRIEELFQP